MIPFLLVLYSSDDTDLSTSCGAAVPEVFVSTGNTMLAMFISDYYLESKGFRARVRFVKDSDKHIASAEKEDGERVNVFFRDTVSLVLHEIF